MDATGSRLYPGRWNSADTPVIYAFEHYSTAMLEKLVHGAGHLLPTQHYVKITIPRGVSYEAVTKDTLRGWDAPEPRLSRAYGARWIRERRSLILVVPSFVARIERNVLINPAHEAFGRIETDLAEPVWWDARLFQR
ncbi:MAG: RES domain-containing protein [Nitrococcus sp.]|nr:RES domain-containing protein [Nitrococcus sp.]